MVTLHVVTCEMLMKWISLEILEKILLFYSIQVARYLVNEMKRPHKRIKKECTNDRENLVVGLTEILL